jgi:hypothetical protein
MVKDMNRGGLTDQQWEGLQPHLPLQRSHTERPNIVHRRGVNRIL